MFEVTVNTRRAIVGTKELITTSSAGIQCQFTFSEDWDGLARFAIFRNGDEGQEIPVALPNSNLVEIPAQSCYEEYVDEPIFVGVYGTDGLGAVIIPTVWVSLGVLRPGAVTTGIITPAEPTPDMWGQILAIANNAAAIADECEGNEDQRVMAETERDTAEELRAANETSRQNAEETRAAAEENRGNAEQTRITAEQSRVAAEQGRAAAENVREWVRNNFLRDGVSATTLAPDAPATVTKTTITDPVTGASTTGSLAFGIPRGEQGIQGDPGTTEAGGVTYDDTLTYPAGSLGAAVHEAKSSLGDLADDVVENRVTTLDTTALAGAKVIEAVGNPVYVDDVTEYPAYQLTATGWYVFARITPPHGKTVGAGASVTGAAGAIITSGADHIDVAVKFEVAAVSATVTINWGDETETFIFKATDLAIRNLDYRVTFYVYDISPFCSWTYSLTADTKFVANKYYYTKSGDEYTLAEVTVGDDIPADTYYVHSKLTIEGMTRNVTYQCPTPVDCPVEFILPEIEDETHGAWFECRFRFMGAYSTTLTVPTGVKVATEHTQKEKAGINMVDLHYTNIDGVKLWRFLNTASSIPA